METMTTTFLPMKKVFILKFMDCLYVQLAIIYFHKYSLKTLEQIWNIYEMQHFSYCSGNLCRTRHVLSYGQKRSCLVNGLIYLRIPSSFFIMST